MLLLVLFGITTALAAAEGLARLAWRLPAPAAPPPRPTPPPALPELKTVFQLSRPNVSGTDTGVFFRTNSAGFRGPQYSERPPRGTFRIVLAGDSVTMGSGVLEEETYAARTEAGLNARNDGTRYQVLNIGLAGATAEQVLHRLERIGLPFYPHLIVYGFTLNDIEGPAYLTALAGRAGVAHKRRRARFRDSASYLLRVVWPRALSLWDAVAPAPGSYTYDLHENYFRNPEAWNHFASQLDSLADIGASRGLCVHMLIHTTPHYLNFLHPFRRIYDRVAKAAEERGITVSQSFPFFQGRDERALVLSAIDPHPNPAGHELLARALLEGLQALPPDCWKVRR